MFRPNIGILFAAPLPLFSKRVRAQGPLTLLDPLCSTSLRSQLSRHGYERSKVKVAFANLKVKHLGETGNLAAKFTFFTYFLGFEFYRRGFLKF